MPESAPTPPAPLALQNLIAEVQQSTASAPAQVAAGQGASSDPLFGPYLREFGLSSFRPLQREIVHSLLSGERPLVVLPTGGGKSLCYQLPALLLALRISGLTVVVSPLQALMQDQVAELEQRGLGFATYLNATLSSAERRARLRQVRGGARHLLYISPEQLRSQGVRALLDDRLPDLWVVDEAHCISQWGHDFRPDYCYLPRFVAALHANHSTTSPLLGLFTATATPAVQESLRTLFHEAGLPLGPTLAGNPTRDNLIFDVVPGAGKEQHLLAEVRRGLTPSPPSFNSLGAVLVYTSTRRPTVRLARLLEDNGIEGVAFYHGGMDRADKERVLRGFKDGSVRVVVATSAFGMGINRGDVRAVIHHTLSASLEGYTQEAGRAGRDGVEARCTLLFDPRDAETIFRLQALGRPGEQDLRNLFIALRAARNRTFGEASEEWFTVTPYEVIPEDGSDDLDEDQKQTRLRVALHHLETFGLIERGENVSSSLTFDLTHPCAEDALRQLREGARKGGWTDAVTERHAGLLELLHALAGQGRGGSVSLDWLAEQVGLEAVQVPEALRELERAGLCSLTLPLRVTLTHSDRSPRDARKRFAGVLALEEALQAAVFPADEASERMLNLRHLGSGPLLEGAEPPGGHALLRVLEGWQALGWLHLRRVGDDWWRVSDFRVGASRPALVALAEQVLTALLTSLGGKKGLDLDARCDLKDVGPEVTPLAVERALAWMQHHEVLRVREGINLARQALRVRVMRGKRESTITHRYPDVRRYHDEQTRRTHRMIQYGALEGPARAAFLERYFTLPAAEFDRLYPLPDEVGTQPLLPQERERILGALSPAQRAIVLEDAPALLVLAGPGSGKTRAIVHRIAYLLKVRRVQPRRILALAYNRQAVRQVRRRLAALAGEEQAARVRIYTFHGLALSLLGRSLAELPEGEEPDFADLLKRACALLEPAPEEGADDEAVREEVQARRAQLLGSLEHIFVDEYQDVSEDEYRLIRLLAGLGQGDETRPVQINLCVIGDDDQNLYEFRGTSTTYILRFEEEFHARRLLLTENYRSTEPIIASANALIRHNEKRAKKGEAEQVHIDSARAGQSGSPVRALRFADGRALAGWVGEQVRAWLAEGGAAGEVAVLARRWDALELVQAVLEHAGVPTRSLRREDDSDRLSRRWLTCHLMERLGANIDGVLRPERSVRESFQRRFREWGREESEPTVQALLRIAEEIDEARRPDPEEPALAVSNREILEALLDADEGPAGVAPERVALGTCHSVKGLEFDRVILLADGIGRKEEDRRLGYVAMTRARQELVLAVTGWSPLVKEAGLTPEEVGVGEVELPGQVLAHDSTLEDVWISYNPPRGVCLGSLHEGALLEMRARQSGNDRGWGLFLPGGACVGALSKRCVRYLAERGMVPGQFEFRPGEVSVQGVVRHVRRDEQTGELEARFVVLPRLRVWR